jgi:hypothetical protein
MYWIIYNKTFKDLSINKSRHLNVEAVDEGQKVSKYFIAILLSSNLLFWIGLSMQFYIIISFKMAITS